MIHSAPPHEETLSLSDEVDEELAALKWFRDSDYTDGLPIVIPTIERVERFLDRSGIDPEIVIGAIPPSEGVANARNVAVNALMAGADPEHLGIIISALRAMLIPEFNLAGIQVTTNPTGPLTIVNGPVRNSLRIDSGAHAFAGGNNPNGPIGRALRFVLRNVGEAKGEADRATLGMPSKYSFCLAENEEDSPWEPLHVSLGYKASDSVVTVLAPESIVDSCRPSFSSTEPLIWDFVEVMTALGTNRNTSSGTLLWVISSGRARILARAGYTRESLQQRLFEDAKFEWGPWGNWEGLLGQRHVEEDGKVLITRAPSDIYIVVAGRSDPHHATYLPSVRISYATSEIVSAGRGE